jgi:hypothetical protein
MVEQNWIEKLVIQELCALQCQMIISLDSKRLDDGLPRTDCKVEGRFSLCRPCVLRGGGGAGAVGRDVGVMRMAANAAVRSITDSTRRKVQACQRKSFRCDPGDRSHERRLIDRGAAGCPSSAWRSSEWQPFTFPLTGNGTVALGPASNANPWSTGQGPFSNDWNCAFASSPISGRPWSSITATALFETRKLQRQRVQ